MTRAFLLRLTMGLLLVTMASTVAFCAAPKAVIEAPPNLPVGATLFVECGQSTGDAFQVLQTSGQSLYGRWFASEKCYIVSCPLEGEFGFTLAAAGVDNGKAAIDLSTVTVKIGEGPGPGPGPNPPGPNPEPLPPGRFDLARQARDWALLVQLPAADRKRTSGVVANSLDSAAAMLAAGAIKDIQTALNTVRSANQSGLTGPEYEAWKAVFNTHFTAAMRKLDEEKKLPGPSDVAEAFRELATGLRAVK